MASPLLIEVDADLTRVRAGEAPWLAAGAPCCECDIEHGCKSKCIWTIGNRPRVARMQTDSLTRVLLNARSIMRQHADRDRDYAMCCVLISCSCSVSRVESTAVVSHILCAYMRSKATGSWMQAQTQSRYRLCHAARHQRGPSFAGQIVAGV